MVILMVLLYISTALCILFYSNVSTYVGLYGSDFGCYVSFPTLFTYFWGFDVPTSSFIFIENVFIILVSIVFIAHYRETIYACMVME